jgi:molybdenum cofactor cytidylyltransferase
MKVSAILMASGTSSRMGENKLLLPYQGKPLLLHAAEVLQQIQFHQLIIVITKENAAHFKFPPQAELVWNPRPEEGQSLSVRLGTEHADGDGYLFVTADQPFLDTASIHQLLIAAQPDNIVVPTVNGTPGSPVFFGKRFRGELLAVRGDWGGRQVKNNHEEDCTYIEAVNKKLLLDIDTAEQYRALMDANSDD